MNRMTTIKVTTTVRDRIRTLTSPGRTQSETIAAALDALDRQQFWSAISAQVPDEEYLAETGQWLDAPLTTPLPRRVGRPA